MILVTGGTGLVGSHLLLELLRKGKKVRALKRPSSDLSWCRNLFSLEHRDDLFGKIEWFDGDILDYFSLEEGLEGVEEVYHSAAVISFLKKDEKQMHDINARGTANMVNACLAAGVKRLGYVSSIAALGRPLDGLGEIDESAGWKNSKLNTHYAISKFVGEREVWRGIAEGLQAFIVNPSIILGKADPGKGSARLFTRVYKGLRFYPPGVNGFVDVRDVVDATIMLMENKASGERYILNAANLSYKDLFSRIAHHLDKKGPTIPAGKMVMEMAWRLEKVRSCLTGGKPLITEETARTSSNRFYYSNQKIRDEHSFSFRDIDGTLAECTRYYAGQLSGGDK